MELDALALRRATRWRRPPGPPWRRREAQSTSQAHRLPRPRLDTAGSETWNRAAISEPDGDLLDGQVLAGVEVSGLAGLTLGQLGTADLRAAGDAAVGEADAAGPVPLLARPGASPPPPAPPAWSPGTRPAPAAGNTRPRGTLRCHAGHQPGRLDLSAGGVRGPGAAVPAAR